MLRPFMLLPLVACSGCAPDANTPAEVANAPAESLERPSPEPEPEPEPPAPPGPGDMAPAFQLADFQGNIIDSRELRGRPVVLDWFKGNCDYTRKLYGGNTYRPTFEPWTQNGVQWFAVVSEGPEGLSTAGQIDERFVKSTYLDFQRKYRPEGPMLLDRKGTLAKALGVVRGPTSVVIDAEGRIAYFGAPNNAPMNTVDGGLSKLVVHVAEALEDLEAERPVRTPKTRPWGCRLVLAP